MALLPIHRISTQGSKNPTKWGLKQAGFAQIFDFFQFKSCSYNYSYDKIPIRSMWSYNYNKPEDGIWWNSKKAMQYNHCMMVLTGDAADNVTGLGKLSPEIIEKYNLRSTKGVGKVSAEAILSGAETEKERWERIIEAYKASWPENGMERLEEMNWFMWLRRIENEYFCLDKYLKRLGIK